MTFSRTLGLAILLLGLLGVTGQVAAKPLTLLDAIQTTLDQNDELAAKQAKLQADEEAINQAWANVKPNVSFNFNSGYAEYDTDFQKNQNAHYSRGTLSVVQPVYSPKRFRTIDRSEKSVVVSKLQFQLDQQAKTLEMVQAYLELAKYIKVLKISEKELVDHVVKVKRLDAMLARGLATKMDILEAQAQYDELKANLIANQNDVKIRQKRLEHLLGVAVEDIAAIDESMWQRSKAIVAKKDWYKRAWKSALSVQVALGQVELAQQEVSVQGAEHWPEINLRLEASKNDSYQTFTNEDKKIQLEMTIPIYQGGGTSSKVAAAQKMMHSQQFLLKDSKRFVKVKLEEVLARLDGSIANISALQQSMQSSEAYLESAQKGLGYGLRGVFDVLEAKTRLYNAERKLTFEFYDNINAQFEFLYLMGRLNYSVLDRYMNQPFNMELLM